MMTREELKKAAEAEDWETVDSEITEVVKDPSNIEWAYKTLIHDRNGNVRDLGVSILEKAHIPEKKFKEFRPTLYKIMTSDDNPYVRYRSAFALTVHGSGEYKEDVQKVLHQAEKDKDVSDLAMEYLSQIDGNE